MATRTIYVELLDEGVDVWRPVEAEQWREAVFLLPDHAPADERWAFPPGSLVVCEQRSAGLTAVALAPAISDADEMETLRRVDGLIEKLPAADEPYWVAVDVSSAASEALVTSLTACHHYRLWTALEDWYELKPDERPKAIAAMRRAATEWLAVRDDLAARELYFDKWHHDVLGDRRD